MNLVFIFPAYKPTDILLVIVDRILNARIDAKVIVVDDGTPADNQEVFQRLSEFSGIVIIRHPSNQGKGRALKTGIEQALASTRGAGVIVTADADGQHDVEDILKVAKAALRSDNQLFLGGRTLDPTTTPRRSLFGNQFMSGILFLTSGLNLIDTQTGLRAFSFDLAKQFLKLRGQRYEFEIQMLLYCKAKKIFIQTIPIQTIYLENNKSSHFRPILDSGRIVFNVASEAIKRAMSSNQ